MISRIRSGRLEKRYSESRDHKTALGMGMYPLDWRKVALHVMCRRFLLMIYTTRGNTSVLYTFVYRVTAIDSSACSLHLKYHMSLLINHSL
jgi:hypothetical protein